MKVKDNQSILDLAIQTCGTAEAAIALAIKNGLSITDELAAGQELQAVDVVNADIANYYKNKRLTPATAITEDMDDSGIFNDVFNRVFA